MKKLIHPINTRILTCDIIIKCTCISTLILYQSLSILLCAHYLRNVVSIRESVSSIECYLCNTCFTSLGLYHYNTISTTCTIDSCRRSILQNLDTLDILRVDTLKTCFTYDTVYYIERVVALAYRACTTYTNLHCTTRNTTRHYLDTRHTSVECIFNTRNWLILKCLAVHNSYRTCQVGFLNCTVTDYHGLFQHVSVFLQSNAQWGACPCNGLCRETNISNCKLSALSYLVKGKFTIDVSYCTTGHTFNSDSSANNRLTIRISYCTSASTLLLQCSCRIGLVCKCRGGTYRRHST